MVERIIFIFSFTALLPTIFMLIISYQYGDLIAEALFPSLISGSIITLSFIGSVIGGLGKENDEKMIIGTFSGIIITMAYVLILGFYELDYGVLEIFCPTGVTILGALISPGLEPH